MNTIQNKICESFIYRLIVRICLMAGHSMFFKPHIDSKFAGKREIFRESGLYRLFVSIDDRMESVCLPIRKAWFESLILGSISDWLKAVGNNSLAGRILRECNIIYLVPLYVYIDFTVRTYVTPIASVWDELLFVGLICWIVFRRIIFNIRYHFTSMDLPIFFFAFVYLMLVFSNAPEMDVAIEGYRAVVQYIFWFFIVVQLVDSKKTAYRMVWMFVLGIGLIGLHGMYQYFTGAQMLGNWVDSNETITTRAYSIIKSPNALASLLVLFLPIAFAVFVAEKDVLKKLVALFCTMTMGLGLIFTFSRGAWMVGFFAFIVLFFFLAKRMIIPIFALVMAATVNINAIWSRISLLLTPEYKSKSSRGGRIYRWATGIEEWSHSKLTGLGVGRYGGAVATNHKLSPFYMDNYYLKTLTEAGLVGLGALLLLLFTGLWQIFKLIKNTRDISSRILMYGMAAGVIAVMGHNFVENIFESPFMVTYFWTVIAILFAYNRLDKNEDVNR